MCVHGFRTTDRMHCKRTVDCAQHQPGSARIDVHLGRVRLRRIRDAEVGRDLRCVQALGVDGVIAVHTLRRAP